jgi:hypothetical protein
LIGTSLLSYLIAAPVIAQNSAQAIYDSMLQAFDPDLLLQAERSGLYDREAFPVLRDINPFYLRGDFNDDGELDLAFWVSNPETRERGVAILHSTLDRLWVFGAGQPRPDPQGQYASEISADTWHLIPKGRTEMSPYGDIPEIGLTEGQPFTFEHETLEFVHLGKSAFVFYWADGQYREFWTAD